MELNRVICEHLFRQGKMEVGEALRKVYTGPARTSECVCTGGVSLPPSLQEADLHVDHSYLDQFTELNHVLEALRGTQR